MLTILKAFRGEGSVASTCALVIGISTDAELQERMSASQQVLRVDIGDGAGRGNIHVATDQDCADGRAGLQRLRLLVVARPSQLPSPERSRRRRIAEQSVARSCRKSVEDEWGVDGLQVVGVILRREARQRRGRRFDRARQRSAFTGGAWLHRAPVHGIDLEHLGDGRNAGDRLLGKFPDTESQSAGEFAVEINRTAAHAGNDAGVLGFLAAEPDQNDVALGPVDILQDARTSTSMGSGLTP